MEEENFEEGKSVEDYVDDLNSLKIDPEPNSQTEQRFENVVESPVRNEKKKPVVEPKKDPVPEVPKPTSKPVAPNIPIVINTDLPLPPPPPLDEESVTESGYPSFDSMIAKLFTIKDKQYDDEATQKKIDTRKSFYSSLQKIIELAATGSVIGTQTSLPPPSPPQPQEAVVEPKNTPRNRRKKRRHKTG
jgi:hypothetical protein